MKRIYALLCLLISISMTGQFKHVDQAFLKQCAETTAPTICTNEKLEADISLLVLPEIMADTRKSSDRDYFTLSLIFISDPTGKVIPAETRILCKYTSIAKKVKHYIENLPLFEPKDEMYTDRRSVHFINLTFVYEQDEKQYYLADREELARRTIKPEYLPLDSYPIFPGCEGSEKDRDLKCLSSAMIGFVLKIFSVPETADEGTAKMMAQLVVETDGRITLHGITGSAGDLKEEAKRVIKQLPKIIPGKISNIPVRVACTLPITVNVGN